MITVASCTLTAALCLCSVRGKLAFLQRVSSNACRGARDDHLAKTSFKKRATGDGEMAPLVKCLPRKPEVLNSGSRHLHKKPGMVASAGNHRAGEAEAGRLQGHAGQRQVTESVRSWFRERLCLKRQSGKGTG